MKSLRGVRTPGTVLYMETTQAAEFGTTVHGNEFSNQTRGIQAHDGVFTAITAASSREFKTLKGAIRHMAHYGFDAHGRRIG